MSLRSEHAKEYNSWKGMRRRCYSPSDPSYKYVGGRGLLMCARWKDCFAAFLEDLGQAPSPIHSVDRIENHRGYDCGKCQDCLARGATLNVRWATPSEQQINSCKARFLEHDGKRLCISDWVRITGLGHTTIIKRIDELGWSIADALTVKPVSGRNRFKSEAGNVAAES